MYDQYDNLEVQEFEKKIHKNNLLKMKDDTRKQGFIRYQDINHCDFKHSFEGDGLLANQETPDDIQDMTKSTKSDTEG